MNIHSSAFTGDLELADANHYHSAHLSDLQNFYHFRDPLHDLFLLTTHCRHAMHCSAEMIS